jgi:ribosome-associated heat shock protein Hsp15
VYSWLAIAVVAPSASAKRVGPTQDKIPPVILESVTRPANDRRSEAIEGESPTAVRLDVWLDVACLFKTRSEAQQACRTGKIAVNGETAKPHRMLKSGEELVIGRPFGRKQRIVVRALADRHIARADAKRLYEDLTPPPTAEEIEMRRLERIYRAAVTPPKAPDKRERRQRRRMKEGT